ncbi:hypothetical protein [Nonomuraea endophytica]|uniref:hypothetical protein n=1 Tax=Nonomuraea endophytica TaxID=714136 RepID=UPI0037C7826F
MQTAVIILTYVLMAAALVISILIADRRGLKESLAQARKSRDEAWERTHKLHQERVQEIEASTRRVRDLTSRLRQMSASTSKEG